MCVFLVLKADMNQNEFFAYSLNFHIQITGEPSTLNISWHETEKVSSVVLKSTTLSHSENSNNTYNPSFQPTEKQTIFCSKCILSTL